ncbi:hypothetical protein AtEden1_Chr5g0113731 [Arabidopsis thaliana]
MIGPCLLNRFFEFVISLPGFSIILRESESWVLCIGRPVRFQRLAKLVLEWERLFRNFRLDVENGGDESLGRGFATESATGDVVVDRSEKRPVAEDKGVDPVARRINALEEEDFP